MENARKRKRGGQPGNTIVDRADHRSATGDPVAVGPRDNTPNSQHAKSRGGQPGNTNALTHGFYSSNFKNAERQLLAEIPLDDLSAEIELLRVTNKRFLDALAASRDQLDFETQLTALRAVNLSAHSIATLLRAHALGALVRQGWADPPLDDEPSDSTS